MTYLVEAAPHGRQPYVAVRTTIPMATIGEAMGGLFEQLYGWLGSHGVRPTGAPFARYLSVGPDEVELEIAAPVAAELHADGGLVSGVIPACEVATTMHIGPYDRLEEAYAAVNAWLGAQGIGPSGAMWETYLDGPDSQPDPDRWRTLVCFPFMRH